MTTLLLALCCLLPATDDLVPATLEALYAAPDDRDFFGIQQLLDADVVAQDGSLAPVRVLLPVGDVTGDGAEDLALGLVPGADGVLRVVDGRSAVTLWSAPLEGGGGFRREGGLARVGDTLVAGGSSASGRVVCRALADGALVWQRNLAGPGAGEPAQIASVQPCDDLDGDGNADLLVAGGHRLDGAWCLSGATGATLWRHRAGDVVYQALPVHDLDEDGTADVLLVGGDDGPRARLVTGDQGQTLWDVPLPGPGSAALGLDDVDGDGVRDVAVGLWNAPGPCLLALDGADGGTLWESLDVSSDVTRLLPLGDLVGTGLSDILVASLDNALSGVLALNGFSEWRREGTVNNGGHMASAAVLGDLDGDGLAESVAASQDHRLYLLGGDRGQFMADHDDGARATCVIRLGDGDGDGFPEIALGGNAGLTILSGAAGLALGPFVDFDPAPLGEEGQVTVFAYPGTWLYVFWSPAEASVVVPGFDQPFGLDLASLFLFFQGPAPGAGGSPFVLPAFGPEHVGLTVYVQAVSVYAPGQGLFSDVTPFTVRP